MYCDDLNKSLNWVVRCAYPITQRNDGITCLLIQSHLCRVTCKFAHWLHDQRRAISTREAADIFGGGHAVGSGSGIAQWHGANGHVGLLSCITRTPRTKHQWFSEIRFLCWLSSHFFEAVLRVCTSAMPPRHSLSLRELEVCQWTAEGKQVSDRYRPNPGPSNREW